MKRNIGTADRLVRLTIAIVCAVAAFLVVPLWAKIGLGIIALFVLYEALAGWCALYALLGKNTCPIE